VIKILFQHPFS